MEESELNKHFLITPPQKQASHEMSFILFRKLTQNVSFKDHNVQAGSPHLPPVLSLKGPIKPGVDFLCPMVFPFCLLRT